MMVEMGPIVRIAQVWWHKMNACDCFRGWFLEGIPCVIGREEMEVKKAERIFAEWDALGLGYIGPRL
jgi:hypothetical protein